MLTIDLIKQAAVRIAGRVHRTPVVTSRSFNEVADAEVFFKCENLQRAGAFKARGATNKILSLNDDEKRRGVIAVSSGNHAQAVALASREAGTPAVICLPEDAPKMKVAATRGYGADIRFFNRHKDDRDAFGREIAERENLVMVPAYDDYLIMAGQGTCGLEFFEEVAGRGAIVTRSCGGGRSLSSQNCKRLPQSRRGPFGRQCRSGNPFASASERWGVMSVVAVIDAAPDPVGIGFMLAVLLFVIAAVILMAVGLILI